MLLNNDLTQEDIDTATEIKALIEEVVVLTHPHISFEMLLLWCLSSEPAEA